MPQNLDDMQFCKNCQMNVFPTRPEFSIKIFGIFAISLLAILITTTILFLSIFTELILFIFFMWGFMILNPYLIYYFAKQKKNCPKCYQIVNHKNLDFQPFGEKVSEVYRLIAPQKKTINRYCPYCGKSLTGGASFCKSCGKKLEIQR